MDGYGKDMNKNGWVWEDMNKNEWELCKISKAVRRIERESEILFWTN